jgi:pimeloyl-ACP methyl ester carboxylesterase
MSVPPVIVLVHGIAAPLEPTYDLPLAGYSILEELAQRGYRAVAFDHRNFGGSDRAPALDRPAVEDPEHKGVHSLDDSVEDIRAIVADACERFGVRDVTLFGSSRGALQVFSYACHDGRGVSMVVMNNPSSLCYLAGARDGEPAQWAREERSEADRTHNYLSYTAEYQRRRWAKLFGEGGKVDAALQDAYIESCLRTDEEGCRREPPVFRVPTESIPDRVPLVPVERLRVPCLAIDAEHKPAAHVEAWLQSVPSGLARMIEIRDSDHFTLRNPKRFELVNIVEAAMRGLAWGTRPAP